MKRTIAFVLTVLLSILLTGCTRTEHIALPFTASDVERVEIFHYVVPADAEKKTVTRPEDIADLVDTFDGLSVTDKETEPVAGGSITSFRFRLFDGIVYEIVYSSIAVMSVPRAFRNSPDMASMMDEAMPATQSMMPSNIQSSTLHLRQPPVYCPPAIRGCRYATIKPSELSTIQVITMRLSQLVASSTAR